MIVVVLQLRHANDLAKSSKKQPQQQQQQPPQQQRNDDQVSTGTDRIVFLLVFIFPFPISIAHSILLLHGSLYSDHHNREPTAPLQNDAT
jgi:hypothetical protein